MPNKWTEAEDRELRRFVACFERETTVNWVEVARRLPGRNNKDCRKRWTKISEQWRKGSWDDAENARLRQAVAQHGTKWIAIAEVVQTRSPDQCQKRWQNALNPELSTADWTATDDEQLRSAVAEYGRNWAHISKSCFPNRSPLSLSNRYTSIASQPDAHSDTSQYHSGLTTTTTASSSPAHDSAVSVSGTTYSPEFAFDHSFETFPDDTQMPTPRYSQGGYHQYSSYGSHHGHTASTTAPAHNSYAYAVVDTMPPSTTTAGATGYYSTSGAWSSSGYSVSVTQGSHIPYDAYADPLDGDDQYPDPTSDELGDGGGRGW